MLTGLFVFNAILAVVTAAVIGRRLSILADIDDQGFTRELLTKDADAVDIVQGVVITIGGAVLVTGVLVIIWMWRAAKNNQALGRERPRFGPGWAIGGWLIPIANLVIPVLMMQDLWRGSDSSIPRGDMRWKIADRSPLVGWWWGLWIASSGVLSFAGGGNENLVNTLSKLQSNLRFGVVSAVLSVGASVLALLVVRRLSQRQDECLRVQNEQWAQQLPPPPPT